MAANSLRTKILLEITLFASLSAVLYTIRPYTLPFGGSVTLGSMVPVMWLSLRRGVRVGIVSATLFGVLALLIDIMFLGASGVVASPVQVIFEYPVAFGVLGFTGVFHRKTVAPAIVGVTISVFLRFLIHYLVGAFVWVAIYQFPQSGANFFGQLSTTAAFFLWNS